MKNKIEVSKKVPSGEISIVCIMHVDPAKDYFNDIISMLKGFFQNTIDTEYSISIL